MEQSPNGSKEDYERAAKLKSVCRDKFFSNKVIPFWLDVNKFYYSVQTEISKAQQELRTWTVDIRLRRKSLDTTGLLLAYSPLTCFGYENYLSIQSPHQNLYSQDIADAEGKTIETSIEFINLMEIPILLLWVDREGIPCSSSSSPIIIPSGKSLTIETYAGYAWLLADCNQPRRRIAACIADVKPGIAVVTGAPVFPPPYSRQLADDPPPSWQVESGPSQASSPDGKWTAAVSLGRLYLHRANSNKDVEAAMTLAFSRDWNFEKYYQYCYKASPGSYFREGRFYWSPDSKKLLAFESTKVRLREMSILESCPEDQFTPRVHSINYPKPGDPLAHRRPCLFHLDTGYQIEIVSKVEDLFPNPLTFNCVRWEVDSRRVTLLFHQRGHQLLRVIAICAETGKAKVIVEERSPTFVSFFYSQAHFFQFLHRTRELIWTSERDGWNHLYLIDAEAGLVKNQITRGEWVVRGVDYLDEEKRQIWFSASGIYPHQDPYYIHHCRINFDGSRLLYLTAGDGTHDPIIFSPDCRFFLDTYSRVDLPPVVELRSTANGALVMELERGDASALLATGWKPPLRFATKGRDHKTDIYGVIFCPMNLNPKQKYPVIEHIYAGPFSSFVPKEFSSYHEDQSLAELGFIVVQIDGMGTSNRSKAFHDVCWKNVGDAGLPDRIIWIKAAACKYPFMDLGRVGIYGVSAGGQNSLRALLMYPEFYKVGVSACGCHDYRLYTRYWCEMWMGWPMGPHYEEQSNVTHAHLLQGKLLLIVPEMDTNVHPSSLLQVVNALVKADKDFDLVFIPSGGHGIGGSYGERRLRDFFVEHLLGVQPRHQ